MLPPKHGIEKEPNELKYKSAIFFYNIYALLYGRIVLFKFLIQLKEIYLIIKATTIIFPLDLI